MIAPCIAPARHTILIVVGILAMCRWCPRIEASEYSAAYSPNIMPDSSYQQLDSLERANWYRYNLIRERRSQHAIAIAVSGVSAFGQADAVGAGLEGHGRLTFLPLVALRLRG